MAVGTTTLITPLLLVGGTGPAAAETPELSNEEAGQVAGGYLARTLEANGGFITGFDGENPDFGSTSNAVLALVEAGVGANQVDEAVALLQENADDYATGGAGNPGALGYLLLVAGATGGDANDFGGVDLPAELAAIEQDEAGSSDDGLFGTSDATFDGVFRQSLALLGLAAVDEAPSEDAVDFLLRQQCDDGSWTAYREDTTEPCAAGTSEVDSTAIAVQALDALGVTPEQDPLPHLRSSQADDGGWQAFGTTNSNTTALAISALVVLGEDVESAQYEGSIGSPYDVLRSLQVGCEATDDRAVERGAFDYDGANESPQANDFATVSAALSVQGAAYPVEEPLVPGDDAQPVLTCAGDSTGGGGTTGGGDATGGGGGGTGGGTDTGTEGGETADTAGGGGEQGGSGGGTATTSPRAADGAFAGTGGTTSASGSLPRTGLDTAPLLALGLGAVVAGVAAVAAGTRRRAPAA